MTSQSSSVPKVLVVGAGISGATVANVLSNDPDNQITVIDKRDHIAGNCYDYRDENGIMIHRYGSHIFHTSDDAIWKFLNQFANFNTYVHKVVAAIDGKEIQIPFNLNSIHRAFPKLLADKLEWKLLNRFPYGTNIPICEFIKQDDEDLRFMSEYVYNNVFLHYTEKQWGKNSSKIDNSVTARVPIRISNDDRYFQDTHQGIPDIGYTGMIRNMLDKSNIKVKLGTNFKSIDYRMFDTVYYSGAVDELMDYVLGPLPYRSVFFEMETIDGDHYQSGAVVNYPNDFEFTRIHEYKYYLGDESKRTVIAKEYSEDFVPGKNEQFYPVPSDENTSLYNRYVLLARSMYPNIQLLGRLGDYRYYNMDIAVKRALDLVHNSNCSIKDRMSGD